MFFFKCSKFRSDVLLDSSVVKLADSVSRQDKKMVDMVQWSAQLDELFAQNIKTDPDIG